MKSYLVQRAFKKKTQKIQGIDSILSFDYMGSAEFEFGALPAALKKLREIHQNLIIATYAIYQIISGYNAIKVKKKFYLICLPEQVEFIQKELNSWSFNDKPTTKEPTYFKESVLGLEENILGRQTVDAWWDIRNNWIVVMDDMDFAKRILKAIPKKTEK